jgi:uncharacterized membrane protein YagU involved in acid resistance
LRSLANRRLDRPIRTKNVATSTIRIINGAAAGIVATVAMTAAMRILYRRLPERERYPLPPREITEQALGDRPDAAGLAVNAHLAYGAGAGALFSLLGGGSTKSGTAFGVAVWASSYLGWIPALQILTSATKHPRSRNELMIAAHLVWGAVLAISLAELERSQKDVFASGPLEDASEQRRDRPDPSG